MLKTLWNWLLDAWASLIDWSPAHLTIVRRYVDANGSYVGELYMRDTSGNDRMLGMSLDTLPREMGSLLLCDAPNTLDLKNDFLAPMLSNTIRVGAAEPKDNDAVRARIARIPRWNIGLIIQNRFIEHVLENRKA
jgi:hypothetical protein